MRHGIKLCEFEFVRRANLDEGALVMCAVAVVGRREDGDAASIMFDLIAFHADFMRSDDGFEAIVFAESLGDIGAKL